MTTIKRIGILSGAKSEVTSKLARMIRSHPNGDLVRVDALLAHYWTGRENADAALMKVLLILDSL